jgi:hypothetical protein
VRGPAFTSVSVADSKNWLDTVGPLVTCIDVYNDFSGVGSGVYRRSTDPSNAFRGGHLFLVVGYDDSLGCLALQELLGHLVGHERVRLDRLRRMQN